MTQAIDQLIGNYKSRRKHLSVSSIQHMQLLIEHGQHPETLLICCSDSRIQPHELFGSQAGDLFIARNIANMVPVYDAQDKTGLLATLEYAINHLHIKNIIIMGHQHCGGIKALQTMQDKQNPICCWMNQCFTEDKNISHPNLEQEAVKIYLQRLQQYPLIQANPSIKLHGWYYQLDEQLILALNNEGVFEAL